MDAPDLTLYMSRSCMFCWRVQRALKQLGVQVAERDVNRDAQARSELYEARGRGTVPVLRIERDGAVEWMPESADIVRYLRERFGGSTSRS